MSGQWWTALDATWDHAWGLIGRGVADRRAAARHPALATAGLDGGAEARIVVLRGADKAARTLEVHTDTASAKARELEADPRASLLIWDRGAHFQMRLKVVVTVAPADAARWAKVPEPAREAYGGTPPPGEAIATPEAWEASPDLARFLVLHCALRSLDTLHLGQDRHRRAQFDMADDFSGRWVAP